jgi:cobaltochelatase CobN
MVYTARGRKYIVIPALSYGNILIAPHPDWGYQQSQKALMSSGALPPHHQYLAFFLWLQNTWKADAWVSLFTNITLQPGKSEGPHVEDAEGVLLGDIPHIHLELLGGSGGIANKRKALALTAGWFRGAVTTDTESLYGALRQQAETAIDHPSELVALRKAVGDADLSRAIGVNLQTASSEELAEAVIHYLDELSHETMSHGSHILGDVPKGETLVQTVLAMLAPDTSGNLGQLCPRACLNRITKSVVLEQINPQQAVLSATGSANPQLVKLMEEAVADVARIRQGGREIGAIVDALDGKRLSPGPADDPLLRADALPAGRSLFSFDAAAIPTQQAEAQGEKAADATIDRFRKYHSGEYPKKLAFVLWTGELSANGGVTEAEILHLLGVRTVRDGRNHMVGVELIPREELHRPRIDVLVTTSGLYRDHYKSKIDLIQQAVLLAQSSSEADNPVRKNSELARSELLKSNDASQDAEKLSIARVFAPAPNAYSPSIQFLAKSGDLRGTTRP